MSKGHSDQAYKAQLGLILRQLNPDALHLFLRQSAAGYGDARQVAEVEGRSHAEMEELMHRMILVRSDLSDLHAASRAWLAVHSPGQPSPPSSTPGAPRLGRGARRSRRRQAS